MPGLSPRSQRAVVGPLRSAHSSRAHVITASRLSAWTVGGVWSTLPALALGYRSLSNSSEIAQTPCVSRRTWIVPPSTSIVRETEASGCAGTEQCYPACWAGPHPELEPAPRALEEDAKRHPNLG